MTDRKGKLTVDERVEQRAPAGLGDRFEDVHAPSIAWILYRRKCIYALVPNVSSCARFRQNLSVLFRDIADRCMSRDIADT